MLSCLTFTRFLDVRSFASIASRRSLKSVEGSPHGTSVSSWKRTIEVSYYLHQRLKKETSGWMALIGSCRFPLLIRTLYRWATWRSHSWITFTTSSRWQKVIIYRRLTDLVWIQMMLTTKRWKAVAINLRPVSWRRKSSKEIQPKLKKTTLTFHP